MLAIMFHGGFVFEIIPKYLCYLGHPLIKTFSNPILLSKALRIFHLYEIKNRMIAKFSSILIVVGS